MDRSYFAARDKKYDRNKFPNVNSQNFENNIIRRYKGNKGKYNYTMNGVGNISNLNKVTSGCKDFTENTETKLKLFKYSICIIF